MNASSSKVVLLDDGSRHGFLPVILAFTINFNNERFFVDPEVVYLVVAAYLGFKEIEKKSGDILPFLPERLKGCDFQISLEFHDSMFRPVAGARQLLETLGKTNRGNVNSTTTTNTTMSSSTSPHNDEPFAVLGGLRSSTTQLLTTLGNPFQLPVMSFSSTAQDLDYSPLFSRTVPTNVGDAMAIATYLEHLGVTHVGIIYVADVWGNAFNIALQNELSERNIEYLAAPYFDFRTASDAEPSIQRLERSKYKYFVSIVNIDTYKPVFYLAYQYGIAGTPGYSWIMSEGNTGNGAMISRDDPFEIAIARATHGLAVIEVQIPTNDKLKQSFMDFGSNELLQKEFINLSSEPEIFDGYNFKHPELQVVAYHHFAFDAAIALGIASCETHGQFTSDEFYETLLQTTFEGVSGNVSFEESGTRALEGLQFQVVNIIMSDELSTPSHLAVIAPVTAEISVANNSSHVHILQDFIYSDNSTIPPLPLPPVDEDLNLISTTSLIFGYIFGGLIIIASISCIIWTYIQRNHRVVRSSQPFFLYLLCIGTIIMALSVIPLSFQEQLPEYWLDVACMSIPWFLLFGFVTAFSAILCKTLRLNKLLTSAQQFRRIVIQPKDVLMPFLILISINTVLLMAWSLVDPMHWHRVEGTNYDLFGRSAESFGSCRLGSSYVYLAFFIPLAIVDLSAMFLALRQCYKARNVNVEYSESHYLFLSMASLWETLILAVPFSYAASQHPSAGFVVSSIIVALLCFTILIPMFVPKFLMVRGYDLTGHSNNNKSRGGNNSTSYQSSLNSKPRVTSFGSRTRSQ